MPLVETPVTSEDIQEATRSRELYRKTWGALQHAESPKEAREAAYNHIGILEEEIGHEIEFEILDGLIEEDVQQIDVIVHLADYDEPLPLLYWEYDLQTKKALGGDLDLY